MGFVDIEGLTTSQAELMAQLRELKPWPEDSWLCFINAGFTISDARALYDRGLIETAKQMGMPVARLTTWIQHAGPVAPVDAEQPVQVKWSDPVEEGVTTQRAGALNWAAVAAYRLAPSPAR